MKKKQKTTKLQNLKRKPDAFFDKRTTFIKIVEYSLSATTTKIKTIADYINTMGMGRDRNMPIKRDQFISENGSGYSFESKIIGMARLFLVRGTEYNKESLFLCDSMDAPMTGENRHETLWQYYNCMEICDGAPVINPTDYDCLIQAHPFVSKITITGGKPKHYIQI